MNEQTELLKKNLGFYFSPASIRVILQACKDAGLTWYVQTDREDKFIPIDLEEANSNPRESCMPRVNGKPFRCECGCNVFKELDNLQYRCNACSSVYQGYKEAQHEQN